METLQNEALRVIFKISILDHIIIEEILSRAKISTIESRHGELLSEYYEKCLIKRNPLIESLFESYLAFKRRFLLNENLAIDDRGNVDMVKLNLIRKTNSGFLEKVTHATILCGA